MRDLLVMFAEQVFAKIVLKIAPDCVNVIGVVLRVIVFQKERWSLHSIIVRLPFFNSTGPTERDFLDSCLLDFLNILARKIRTHSLDVSVDQAHQSITLALRKVGGLNANLLQRL